MNITVSIPYYNRSDLVMETIKPLLYITQVDEILICDDCSPSDDFEKLINNTCNFDKVKIVKNVCNFHNQHNKRNALSFAKNEWVLLLDNDNIAKQYFFDCFIKNDKLDENLIYHPAFASPNFDYRKLNGFTITKENARDFCRHSFFSTLLNTNNYFVHKGTYLSCYEYDAKIRGADGIFFSYNWLKAGKGIYIMNDSQYFHRVHDGSEFLRESKSNMELLNYWFGKFKNL
jgi:hypothetical protein